MEDIDIKTKVRNLFTKLAISGENLAAKDADVIPKSITFTKTALPILYSNLILIEDMKYENSNYFLGANGFVSKKITLSSLKHDPNFSLSNCAFRIFPRTYNVNKYKVLDFINQKGKVDFQDINFKFSAEIFNNLDIVQNKFAEPVRYGDIVMLMHDNTHMFIKYVNSTKSLTFSNHDGDATLFSVEPATEIMLNDNQILKSGQPIRLKVAGFSYASQNLYFGLSVPYSSSNKVREIEAKENEEDENNDIEQYENSEDLFSFENNTSQNLFYDKKLKKYKEKPDLVVEENSSMNWRFVLYNPFTNHEDLISFGDFIQIIYCDQNGVLGSVSEIKEIEKKKAVSKDIKKSMLKAKKKESFDLKENILVPDDEEILIDDITDKDLIFSTSCKNTKFYLSNQIPYNKNTTEDVNSTWILENVYPYMKMQSFIRFYEDEKLDTYRMTFRIKHFKTNKILSIAEVNNESEGSFLNIDKGIIKGTENNESNDNIENKVYKLYKFVLIDDIIENSIDEEKISSNEYQFSLFGFKKTNKSKSVDSTKPSINDFLKLYHIRTQSYVKIITDNKKKSLLKADDILDCYLTLIKYPDEKEVIRIERVHYNTQWKFKFIQNLYYLTCYIIQNLKQELKEMKNKNLYQNENIINNENLQKIKDEYLDNFSGEEKIEKPIFAKLKFVLDKLLKFIMNKFINKYNDYCGFSNVVHNRQLLISYFDFSNLLLVKLIYFYWLHDNNLGRIRKIENILIKINNGHEANTYLELPRDKALYQMFRYTESIFQFMIIYCKDNSEIKKELYKYLYVFFIFINLSGPCIDALIEIFKNEESNLDFINRDCMENKQFKSTLELLFKEYFNNYYQSKFELLDLNAIDTAANPELKNQPTKSLTLFDLILEYLKISEYSFDSNYDKRQIISNREVCEVNSFNSREKYIQLLIALIHMDNKANIQDNQIYLIKKIIKIFAGNYILDPTLSGEESNYPPCLINLIYELAKDTKMDDKNNMNYSTLQLLHEFIKFSPNFKDEKLEENLSDTHYSCNSKIYSYIKENKRNQKDIEKVSKFFEKQKNEFLSSFKSKNNNWHINFLDSRQVELSCSTIEFMKNMIRIDLLSPQEQKEFLKFLISFLRLKYTNFSNEKISNIIQGDMIIKEKSILERITKTEHEKYISISETWHKIYQIFRLELINQIEDQFYQKEQKTDFKHLKSRKKGDPPLFTMELIENDDNNYIKNFSSQDRLVDTEEKDILKEENIKNQNKESENNLLENEPTIKLHKGSNDKSDNSMVFKKSNTFDRLNAENRNYETITKEEIKKEKKTLLTRKIVSIFRLLIRKNLHYLKNNFINYYLHKVNNNEEFSFDEFVEKCVPSLEDKNENINKLIKKYCESKIGNTFSSSEYINLNTFFESDDLNFIQNIIISFAFSEEEEIQEILIGLLYKYFHQRRALFRDIFQFNEFLLPENRKYIENLYSSEGRQKIKEIFSKFYQNYELSKNKYDSNRYEKINDFLKNLIIEILKVFENIFNYWKAELIFKNNNNYDKKKIDDMVEKIKIIKNSTNDNFTQEVYLNNLSHISYFLYYIRNNSDNQYISSIMSILNEHGELYLKMFFSLFDDFINKGKTISSYFSTKYNFFSNRKVLFSNLGRASNDEITSIKNKFFISLILLIIMGNIILPKDEKSLSYLIRLLEDQIDLLRYDSYCNHLILLLVSDIQKLSFSLDYFFIFNTCGELTNKSEYFGTLRNNYENEYPISFSILYLDIIYNVLSFIIYKNKMINETYLDENIADIFLMLLKKMNITKGYEFNNNNLINDDPKYKDKIKLLMKLIKTINLMSNVEQLNKVMMLKIDPMNSSNFNNEIFNICFKESKKINNTDNIPIVKYYPLPHNLYQLFIYYLNELYNDAEHKLTEERALRYTKNILEIYKYILYYITCIDTNYFKNQDSEINDEKKPIKNFILYVLYGYSHKTKNNDSKSIDLSFIENQAEDLKKLLDQLTISSLYLLFNQITVVKYFDFCHKEINGIKIEQEEVKKNCKAIFDDFYDKAENINKNDILENNIKLNTEIAIKTSDNNSVNIFILRQIEEIFLYSITMDASTTSKIKLENNENKGKETDNAEKLGGINYKITFANQLNEKDQRLFDHNRLRAIIEIIKQMIIQYESREIKSNMVKFQKMLIDHKKDLHIYEKKESSSIIYYILSFLDGKNKTEIIFTHFIQKSVDFINNTLNLNTELTSKRIKYITYLIYIIKKILSFYKKKEGDLETSDFRKKTLREMQMVVEKTGLIKICLKFIKKNNEKLLPFINAIFKMFCQMLNFGETNKEVTSRGGSNGQKLFYNIFNIRNDFEPFFSFMTETINKKIQTIISNKFLILRNKKKNLSIQNQLLLDEYEAEIDENILEFLQLLCENHNRNLQLYLHKQKNFRRDYDLVTDTQHYLNILFNNFEPFLFNSLCRCFDLLIEMIQGPCFESQLLLINSKLLVTINDLLKYYLISEINELYKKFPKVNVFKETEFGDLTKINKGGEEEDNSPDNTSYKKNFYKMSTKQISLLTYKATILLQALVDSRNKFDPLYGNMMNIISADTLTKLYIKIYYEHLTLIAETNEIDDYLIRLSDFNRAKKIEDEIEDEFDIKQEKISKNANPEEYLILETGFYAYFLWRYYQDYNSTSESNECKEIKNNSKWENILNFFKKIFFIYECLHFLFEFFYAILKTICLIIGLIIQAVTFGKVKKFNLIRYIFNRREYQDNCAKEFYNRSTASIEVLKEENVYIIYFFKLPFCNGLNKFEKQQFLESMDRTNTQSKLMDIMRYSDQVKYELETDYKIKEFASKIPIFGVILTNIEFWKDLSLLISICLNLLNFLASHYAQTSQTLCIGEGICIEVKKWNEIQTLGGLDEEEYDNLIQSLSFFQCIIGCLIYAEYMARKSPSIYKLNKELAEELNYTGNKKTFYILRKTIYEIVTSFSVIYYTGVVVFGFLGIYKSNFFFSYLLLEIVTRFKTLQNVLVAIKNPYKELILIFILWIILIYYFSIIGYVWFRDTEFPRPDKDCNSLLKCVATIFHQNNRMDNGISGYLKARNLHPSKNPFTWRFFYDEIGNLMLKILIVNMISGIIIDNFAALRKSETEMIYDMNNICTICSLKKDKIIKVYKNYGKDYNTHQNTDHFVFNYIFYIIYIYKKEKTELNGMESYIYESAFIQKDITWFPIKKLYIAKPEELEIDSDEEDDEEDSDD